MYFITHIIRPLLFVAAVVVFAATPLSAYARDKAPVFFSALQDVPVMQGLEELVEQSVVFDKPQGRIVEAVALIDGVSQNEIRTYYAQALPQLGWRRLDDNLYARGKERLRLMSEAHDGQNFLRIMVSPN